MFVVAVYVDDIVLGGRSEAEMNAVKEELSQKFEMNDLGPPHHFLGVKVIQDQLAGVIWIGQPSYTEKILQKLCMYDSNLSAHLSILMSNLRVQMMCVISRCTKQSLGTCYIFLQRPDQIYCLCRELCCSFLCQSHERILDSCEEDFAIPEGYKQPWSALIIERTPQLKSSGTQMPTGPEMLETGSQPLGIYFFWEVLLLAGRAANRLGWPCQPQKQSMLHCLLLPKNLRMWLQLFTSDLLNKNIRDTILEDNQSAICLAKSQQVHGRTKHIDIKDHFIRDLVEAGRIKLTYRASEDMVADMLTKGLIIKQFEKLQLLAGIAEFTH